MPGARRPRAVQQGFRQVKTWIDMNWYELKLWTNMNKYELIWIDTWCPKSWIGLWRIGCRAVHHELNCELLLWIVYLKIWIKHFFVGSYWFMLIQVFQFLNHKFQKHDLIWINMNQSNSTWFDMIWCELLWTNVKWKILLNQYEAVWTIVNVHEPIWISMNQKLRSIILSKDKV